MLQLAHLLAWIEPELVGQVSPRVLVDLEGLALPSVCIQSQHEQPPHPLAPGVVPEDAAKLNDRFALLAALDSQREQLLGCLDPQLLQPFRLPPSEPLARQVIQRRPGPDRERFLEKLRRDLGRTSRQGLPGTPNATFEAGRVELVVGNSQPVTRRGGDQSGGVVPEGVTEARDVHLDSLVRAEGLLIRPQAVRQQFRCQRSVALEHKEREQDPLARATEVEGPSIGEDGEVA